MRIARAAVIVLLALAAARPALAQSLPALTGPVNDFAHVIDADSARELDRRIRALETTTRDAIVVVTVDSYAPYGSIEEYAVKLFERAGIGQRNQDNGLLIVMAIKERRVKIEVGYGLEEYITDGYAGDTIRQAMLPEFRAGRYGAGFVAGTTRLIQRIAEKRGVTVPDLPVAARSREQDDGQFPIGAIIFIVIIILMFIRRSSGPRSRYRRWGGPLGGGWIGGVGGFGRGGFGGGSFGGGGGGFGGFGGGRSGGGGASGGW
ncbi:MAG TPA: TPM domain-containing protein [Vicinamibacterales bacterium]|nr:TPM domain-containing protein [Vicinamibacterales bacterium]